MNYLSDYIEALSQISVGKISKAEEPIQENEARGAAGRAVSGRVGHMQRNANADPSYAGHI